MQSKFSLHAKDSMADRYDDDEYDEQEKFPVSDAHTDTAGADHGDELDEGLPREDRDADEDDAAEWNRKMANWASADDLKAYSLHFSGLPLEFIQNREYGQDILRDLMDEFGVLTTRITIISGEYSKSGKKRTSASALVTFEKEQDACKVKERMDRARPPIFADMGWNFPMRIDWSYGRRSKQA